ncbi:MurR/RpiR family transcriptional regulator [Lacticaseibacillus kribbianus]|uniref:MurR/RpiR family transcriptional regulator n=1 Tax=Lacticaseibacillus kribbianus TaxID=2926292 RepID=UPI001CD62DF2|nr:MurR/RpiR family transcriptional regulator [Lacticaseibacillus kribbianus]
MTRFTQLAQGADLTATERRIADYIAAQPEAATELTIQQLAAKTFASHSAVVRLAKKLGFAGFVPLRKAIAAENLQRLLAMRPVDANFPFRTGDSALTIAQNLADLTTATVRRTLAQLDAAQLSAAADRIQRASRLFLFAVGDSQIRARSFQNEMTKLNKFAVLAGAYQDESWAVASLTPSDLAIFISYSGAIPSQLRTLQVLANCGVPTLLITGNAGSAGRDAATQTLVCAQPEYDLMKVGTFASQAAFEYVLDTLFAILYARDYQRNLARIKTRVTRQPPLT